MNNIIKINNLTKVIKGKYLLKNINLEISSPGVYGIVGRNGSGKSILFKSIAGLLSPTAGSIHIFNKKIGNGSFPESFGAILDTPGFISHYSGYRNLKLLASIQKIASDEDIKRCISIVGLDYNDKTPVKKYSLGMKQRLGIAQSIMENPNLLILDEPMNGLDEDGINDIRNMLLDLKKEGKTLLLASHNSEDIRMLCDAVYKMESGELKEINY
ncbi:ATP-binding cassette domain-containing protein [Bacillus sp. PS06]|uniref:ATP-binding cassette domain-containing protein n=1 Tax=Bacillus sp. PS06 TaxID=2764176 RepID=UPI0017838DA3|nr:ABC transporter ATP-binding protein [Bacillus sp. PS06]MBD8067354.1 ABC transporter ATP-binding protein [Bacillus sp. PS06]